MTEDTHVVTKKHAVAMVRNRCTVGYTTDVRDVPTVVGTDHHSDKMTTTTNSLTNTKISA